LSRLIQHCLTIIIISVYLSGTSAVIKAQIPEQALSSKYILLFKLVSMNNNMDSSGLDTLRIGVLRDENSPDSSISEIELSRIASAEFEHNKFIQTRNLNIFSLSLDSLLKLSNDIPQVLLINSVLEPNLDKILQYCRLNSILSFTFDSTFVSRGVSVGLCSDNKNHIKILINWEQLNAEGGGFDAQILQLAKIYRKTEE